MFVEFLARLWSVNDPLPIEIDVLALVAHGATPTRLAHGATAVVERTKQILVRENMRMYPLIGFAAYSGSEKPELEESLKIGALYRYGSMYFGGFVFNTIMECVGIKNALPLAKKNPKTIVVVTDEAHSRRCKIVWKVFFPKSKIYVVSVPIASTVDPESPMATYHKLWKILWNQAWPIVVFKPLSWFGEKGLLLLKNQGQPVSK